MFFGENGMNQPAMKPTIYALMAAFLFGLSIPLNKLLLGNVQPLVLSGLLYLGSGLGILLFRFITERNIYSPKESILNKNDIVWLIGAILNGGIAAPLVLLYSIRVTPASTASLLLSFEGIATTLIAGLWFGEYIGKKVWFAAVLVTLASIFLSIQWTEGWGFSIGAIGVLAACFLWGIDNNLTRNISNRDPLLIVIIKGSFAGSFSLLLAYLSGMKFPLFTIALISMFLGVISYGMSIVLFILALRHLGSSRTTTLYSIAPFVGSFLSFLILGERPQIIFYLTFPLIIIATFILLTENHQHRHVHEHLVHDHRHTHTDGHHNHVHENLPSGKEYVHSHPHDHEQLTHNHPHLPDIHHRHRHNEE